MEWLAVCILVQIHLISAAASPYGMQPLYPRPALFDMQLTSSIQVNVKFNGITQDVHATFSFLSHGQCVKGESYNYTVVVWKDGATQPCHIEGPFMAPSCDQRLDVTTYGLHRSQHYTAMVAAYNENISIKSKKVDLYTSAVQSVDVVKGEECVVVTCYFAAGSNARGCALQMKIVATYTSQHLHLWHFNISRDPDLLMGTLHVPLEPKTSVVEVTVHDLTVSGRVGFLSIPPHISHSSTFHCAREDTVTPFRAKAKMVLFYVSASFFLSGVVVVFIGMLCKVGKLHRHFRNRSYEILEGRDSTQQHSSTPSSSVETQDTRRQTHPQPGHVNICLKPRAKTYGSYDLLDSPAVKGMSLEEERDGDKESVETATTDHVPQHIKKAEWNCLQREASPDAYHSMAGVDGIQ